jgi:hypothetical protein
VFTGRSAAGAATTGGPRGWLSVRHSLGLEAALVVTLYGVYEPASGLVVGNTNHWTTGRACSYSSWGRIQTWNASPSSRPVGVRSRIG